MEGNAGVNLNDEQLKYIYIIYCNLQLLIWRLPILTSVQSIQKLCKLNL